MSQPLLSVEPLPLVWRLLGSISFGADPKDSLSYPHHLYVSGPEGGRDDIAGGVSSLSLFQAIVSPLGISTLLILLQRRPPVPCYIPQLALPARSFKQIKLKGPGKMYICGECKRHTCSWDSTVSHCLHEGLVSM